MIHRFRLLKEQEAKRRREKEEARLKAEASIQNTNKAQEQDDKSDTAVVSAGDNEKNELSAVQETTDGAIAVNGKPSIQKDETTNGKFGVDHDIEQHHSHET